MITHLIIPCSVISAIALLWRIASREKFLRPAIGKLPYLIQKPLTCGVCFTFWISFFSQFFILRSWPRGIGMLERSIPHFFISWMLTGMISVFIFYAFLTLYEGSHYLAHKAEKMHEPEK